MPQSPGEYDSSLEQCLTHREMFCRQQCDIQVVDIVTLVNSAVIADSTGEDPPTKRMLMLCHKCGYNDTVDY